MASGKRRATYEDLCRVPDTMVAEILDGELFASPRPAIPHALLASVITGELGPPFNRPPGDPDAPGGWWLLFEPELHLGADVLVPDLAAWRRERVPVMPNVPALTVAPDWACELLSPSTSAIDRGRKMRIYAREGVGHLWLADPVARTLEVYRLERGGWVAAGTYGDADVVRIEPFAAIELRLARWWLDG